jgi:hypothetical protein
MTIRAPERREDWRRLLELHLKAGADVDVIGLDCEADKNGCTALAERYDYYYTCHPKVRLPGCDKNAPVASAGAAQLEIPKPKHPPDYARFRNKKFHSRPPPDLVAVPQNLPVPKSRQPA